MIISVCTRKWCRLMIWTSVWISFLLLYARISDIRDENSTTNPNYSTTGLINRDIDYPVLFGDYYFSPIVMGDHKNVIIYSAYIDFRHGNMGNSTSVRLMALARTEKHDDLYCQFSLSNERSYRISATWYETPEPHGAEYAAYVISCAISNEFDSIELISDLKFLQVCLARDQEHDRQEKCIAVPISNYVIDSWNATKSEIELVPYRRQHTVCVPTLFGDRYSKQHLIEYIEANTILGADYFVFYVYDKDLHQYKHVLEYYRNLNRLTYFILHLPIDSNNNIIWNYAQSLVIEDCVFRNAGYSRYVILNDLDEHFVPYAADTWSELSNTYLWKEPNRAGYAVRTFYFRLALPGKLQNETVIISNLPPPPLTHKLIVSTEVADSLLTKCIIRPERVFDQGIHHVSRVIQDYYLVSPMDTNIGALHHFKNTYSSGTSSVKTRLKELMKKENRFIQAYNKASTAEKRQRAKYVWRCELCNRGLCSKRSYLEHKNTHASARPFKCEFCDYAAASQMTLRRHTLRQHVPRSMWHYPCPYCEQAFVEPTSYQAHLRHKHIGRSGTYGCDLCEYKTLSSKNFSDHTMKHASERSGKRLSPASIKDFTTKDSVNKFLIEDELGVGWNSVPPVMIVDQQLLSLRRVSVLEQERRRRSQPAYPHMTTSDSWHRQRHPAPYLHGTSSTIRDLHRRPRVGIEKQIPDRNMVHAVHSGYTQPPTVSNAQSYFVPDAECFVEVKTDDVEATNLSSKVPAWTAEMTNHEDSESEDGDNNDYMDDDTSSCSSDESGDGLEIDARLTALTAGIDANVHTEVFDECVTATCQDLGNDVLPDGQVDFDLD